MLHNTEAMLKRPRKGFGMKVKDLLVRLAACPQESEVCFFNAFGDKRPVADVSPEDSEGSVLLGSCLPPEAYARDFKYE